METNPTNDYVMSQDDVNRVNAALDAAFAKPMWVHTIIVDGFAFHIHWDDNRYWATMFFKPDWGHSHGCYGYTKERFIKSMSSLIGDAKKIYVNGGKFPIDYYKLIREDNF